jgi:hypothetical protein
VGKEKIHFEIDQDSLANAKAYVARHGGTLNQLVSALFDSLGQDEQLAPPAFKGVSKILLAVSAGKLSIVEGADLLELPDAGFVLHLLADNGLPLPKLRQADVRKQADNSLDAMRSCLIRPTGVVSKRKSAATSEE